MSFSMTNTSGYDFSYFKIIKVSHKYLQEKIEIGKRFHQIFSQPENRMVLLRGSKRAKKTILRVSATQF